MTTQLRILWAPSVLRLYAELHPTGRWEDPCGVLCRVCGYRAVAGTMADAQDLAARHDQEKHANGHAPETDR